MVCSPVAPGSKLFAPSPVHVAVTSASTSPVSCSHICNLLKFWLGSPFESFSVAVLGKNWFQFLVSSSQLAAFIVALGSIRHGRLLALFALPRAACVNGLVLGPTDPYAISVTRELWPDSDSGTAEPTGPRDVLGPALSASPLLGSDHVPLPGSSASPSSTRDPPPVILAKRIARSRRSPLALCLLWPGILPCPAGPLPWPVHAARDPSPLPSLPCQSLLPISPTASVPFPLSPPAPASGQLSLPGCFDGRAAVDGQPCLSYSQVAASPSKPLPPAQLSTPPPLSCIPRCHRCLASDHFIAECRDPLCCRRCRRSGHLERDCKLPPYAPSPSRSPLSSFSCPQFRYLSASSAAMDQDNASVRLLCELCFGSDHSRSVCRLAVPAIPDEGEEEDPEELVPEDGSSEGGDPAVDGGDGFMALGNEDGFLPIADAFDYLPAPEAVPDAPDAEDLVESMRPDYVDVFMPHVHLQHFDHLAYAFINPPPLHPDNFILQAADLGCGPDRVYLLPSSRGARVAVFSAPYDRGNAVANGPYLGREATVFFERHDETDNRFIFEHETLAALAIEDYPLEHWQRDHIIHSSGPYANPHTIDPVCLTGLDFSVVLVTVKAESLFDIPKNLNVKNHCSVGTIGKVSIIGFQDLIAPSDDSGPDSGPIPEAESSGDEEEVVLQGGEGYAQVLQALGVPPPLVDHAAPSSAAPAASLVAHAIANAPPSPLVLGDPLRSKPKHIFYRMFLGFFDIVVIGALGESAFYRVPMKKLSLDPSCHGLQVVNLASASIGLIESIARVGPLRRPTLIADILVRGQLPSPEVTVALSFAEDLVMGLSSKVLPGPGGACAA
uniref:Uncharacterized protein n=1 Tax=Avena sativa TaxID=4498 RepID=A0ACD5X706_AVESA